MSLHDHENLHVSGACVEEQAEPVENIDEEIQN